MQFTLLYRHVCRNIRIRSPLTTQVLLVVQNWRVNFNDYSNPCWLYMLHYEESYMNNNLLHFCFVKLFWGMYLDTYAHLLNITYSISSIYCFISTWHSQWLYSNALPKIFLILDNIKTEDGQIISKSHQIVQVISFASMFWIQTPRMSKLLFTFTR